MVAPNSAFETASAHYSKPEVPHGATIALRR